MRRRRFLERTHKNREDRARSGRFNPGGMIRLAGFGAAILVLVAVYIGFHRDDEIVFEGGHGAVLASLVRPLIFGVNALEILSVVVAGLIAWRIWIRMNRS